MHSFSTFSALPVAAATAHFLAIQPSATSSIKSVASPKQAFTARQLATMAAQRAKVLARRRTSIPTSAKRW